MLACLRGTLASRAGGLPPHLYHQTVEQAAVAISITDLAADILYVNPAFEKVTGYQTHEVVGRNESILSDPSTPRSVYRDMWSHLQAKKTWEGVVVNRRRDGSRYLADLTIVPVVDATGAATHYLGLHRDITTLHKLQREVLNQKGLIESMIDASPSAIALLNGDGKVVLENLAYKKLISELGIPELSGYMLDRVRENVTVETGRGFENVEVRGQKPGRAERWFACSGSWFRERTGDPDSFFVEKEQDFLLLIIREITEIHRQQETVRMSALRALLAEEELVQGLRETLLGAIFQMEMPLNMLNAASSILERRSGDPALDPIRDVLLQALQGGRSTIEKLRGCVPSNSGGSFTPLNPNEILRDVLTLLTPRLLTEGVVVDWAPAAKLPVVAGKEHRLIALLRHLVENAIDAMSTRGWVDRELRIATAEVDGAVEIAIQDSGPGIDEAMRFRVFEPFFTTKQGKGHSGMGLVIAQEIAVEHGGSVRIALDYSPGCRVVVRLPVDQEGRS
ncbi:MAG: nitrogen fixation negative regulator NifL [Proteobacteria bacterium CG1_02_64_396]|nr:MAG: nitrogen fixation negative regulator NifL [Proteobacteria bacterium CG1_02_64_396]